MTARPTGRITGERAGSSCKPFRCAAILLILLDILFLLAVAVRFVCAKKLTGAGEVGGMGLIGGSIRIRLRLASESLRAELAKRLWNSRSILVEVE